MRIRSLLSGDIRFQFRYGFYFLYLIFTLLYISLIFAFSESWREKAAILMIFTDPTAMGLYFMGAIVLFEKSERTLDSLAVSPADSYEYLFSKLISIGAISLIVGFIIGFFTKAVALTVPYLAGIFICSCLFSSLGFIIAAKSASLNGFIISAVPFQLLINIPAIVWLFGWRPGWLLIHPGVCLMVLSENGKNTLPAFLILETWALLAAVVADRSVKIMFWERGGIKL